MSFNFPPKGYALCNGQILAIVQNQALFALLGTTFGGNGQTTFALPNLQGRSPFHVGNGFQLGQAGGEERHTVIVSEMPQHNHELMGVGANAAAGGPGANAKLANATTNPYRTGSGATVPMKVGTVSSVGGSQPHENRQPFLTLNFVIALQGIFPSRN